MVNIFASSKITPYSQYKRILKEHQAALSERLGTKVSVNPTAKKLVQANGVAKETLETLQTMEYITEYYRVLKLKGYTLPKSLNFDESFIPRGGEIAGLTFGKDVVFNPRCIHTIDPRVIVHENGHQLSNNKWVDSTLFLRMMDRVIPHLNKKERAILEADYKRAYQEGCFKYNPLAGILREGMVTNRIVKQFRKAPEQAYLPNSLQDREEFIADYFNLAVRGFKFSPEITAKYRKYGGPEIKGIITPQEAAELEKLHRSISKKTLGDYGVSLDA